MNFCIGTNWDEGLLEYAAKIPRTNVTCLHIVFFRSIRDYFLRAEIYPPTTSLKITNRPT